MKSILILTLLFSGLANAKMSDGGSNIGGGNIGSEYTATWCKNQTSLLRNYRDRAISKVNSTGNFNQANKILIDGMTQALNSLKETNDSFLAKSLVRGLEIATNIEAYSIKNSEKKSMITNNVLTSYYTFMIETVAKDLDLGAYIPYKQSSYDQLNASAAHFEEKFVNYAKSQLDWIIQNLTKTIKINNSLAIIPVGDTKTLLKVAISLTKGTAEDLDESLWNKRFSCAISDLEILNQTISLYDLGNKEMFDSDKEATEYLTLELARISKSLSLNSSCN